MAPTDKHDPPGEFELRPYERGDENALFPLLRKCHPTTWGKSEPELWRWKHSARPGFTPDDIIVVRRSGRVVGCFHGAVLPLRLGPGITVSASYDGDYAVLPEARGNDLTGRAYAHTDADLVRRGVAVRGGFTSKELNERHYGKKYGYVFVRSTTGQFRKMIGLGPLRARVDELGQRALARPRLRRALTRHPLEIGVAIEGLPEAILRCDGRGFTLTENAARDVSVSVQLPYRLLATLPDGIRPFALRFVGALLRRRARIRGIPTAVLRLSQLTVAAVVPAGRST